MISQTPAIKQKNPKRVAAGKAVAQRTKLGREAQKKAFIENQLANVDLPAEPVAEPVAEPAESAKNVLTTT